MRKHSHSGYFSGYSAVRFDWVFGGSICSFRKSEGGYLFFLNPQPATVQFLNRTKWKMWCVEGDKKKKTQKFLLLNHFFLFQKFLLFMSVFYVKFSLNYRITHLGTASRTRDIINKVWNSFIGCDFIQI